MHRGQGTDKARLFRICMPCVVVEVIGMGDGLMGCSREVDYEVGLPEHERTLEL